eukprot:CAMPEP_0181454264 /NCGR_PEP_ID=MMETSP1110-20121109/30148_1 /TAXON_ID=174948 /ORGANISM="Symbiodinium sp., Strain CCMP421" /LENGTH=188 /DNA_ID=CAMNT_0023578603 /DNA_START=297 /DNA_END=864 /DNA_ORIENTATION=+
MAELAGLAKSTSSLLELEESAGLQVPFMWASVELYACSVDSSPFDPTDLSSLPSDASPGTKLNSNSEDVLEIVWASTTPPGPLSAVLSSEIPEVREMPENAWCLSDGRPGERRAVDSVTFPLDELSTLLSLLPRGDPSHLCFRMSANCDRVVVLESGASSGQELTSNFGCLMQMAGRNEVLSSSMLWE